MNNAVNNKRMFLVAPHVPVGYLDIVARRDDVRLDKLENDNPSATAKSVLAAAHAYQTSSTATSSRGTTTPAPSSCTTRRTC
jgi:hypothetical protein